VFKLSLEEGGIPRMARFKIWLEYQGTKYRGWQIQQNARTVQGELRDAITSVFPGMEFEFQGAGRTDAGVHALLQVAHLDVKTDLPLLRIKYGINDRLPPDISVIDVEAAEPHFHARHDAVARSYIYQISRRRTAFGKKFVWWIKDDLSAVAMNEAAEKFIGLKDFRNFPDLKQEQASIKTEVTHAEVKESGDMILFHVIGSHFLWKQVRRMTGVLVEIGRGKLTADDIRRFFRETTDIPAKLTAPPSGLFLERVYYTRDDIVFNANPVIYI